VYGPVRTVVWEDGGREAPSYPIYSAHSYASPRTVCGLWFSRSREGA
jgi:hypothetical protein